MSNCYLIAKLLSNSQGDRSLPRSWWTCHQDGPSGHFLGLDEVNYDAGSLSGLILTNQAGGDFDSLASFCEAETLKISRNVTRILN